LSASQEIPQFYVTRIFVTAFTKPATIVYYEPDQSRLYSYIQRFEDHF